MRDRFAGDDPAHSPTLGCDCSTKVHSVDGQEVMLYLYDTAGQERFADMASNYYRLGDVCILCFDMSNLASFDHAKWWQKRVLEVNSSCSFVLVGTKEDLVMSRRAEVGMPEFDPEFIQAYARDTGMPFFATSAKDIDSKGGQQINLLFHTVAEKCLRSHISRQLTVAQKSVRLTSAFGGSRVGSREEGGGSQPQSCMGASCPTQ